MTIVFVLSELILIISLILPMAFAAQDHCENLNSAACTGLSEFDGTGHGFSSTQVSARNTLLDDRRSQLIKEKLLKAFEQANLFEQAYTAFNADQFKDCRDLSKQTPACRDAIAERISAAFRHIPTKTSEAESPINLRLLNDFLRSTPIQSLFLSANRQVYSENGLESIQGDHEKVRTKVFPAVQKLMLEKINSLPLERETKRMMLDRIRRITYDASLCDRNSPDQLSAHFVSNAWYSPSLRKFSLCSGLLSGNTSEFMLANVIAHELSHSIDPCFLSLKDESGGVTYVKHRDIQARDDDHPLPNLLHCLRSSESIGAQNFTEWKSPIAKFITGGYNHCGHDHINESFCDWMAAEVLVPYINQHHPQLSASQWKSGAGNAMSDICNTQNSTHPAGERRINKILSVQPDLREKMGCTRPAAAGYCDGLTPTPRRQQSQSERPNETSRGTK